MIPIPNTISFLFFVFLFNKPGQFLKVSNITQSKVSMDYLSVPGLLRLVPSEAIIHSIAKLAPKIVGTIL